MVKPAKIVSSGRAKKRNGKKQFNAALTEQLVLDFNQVATQHGRDELLEDLIYRFLEKARPESPSVLQFRNRRTAQTREPEVAVAVDEETVAELDTVITHREALQRVRELAKEIVQVTTEALMRKPPKASPPRTPPSEEKMVVTS
jgi:predicted RNase H-like HicB family nuclease